MTTVVDPSWPPNEDRGPVVLAATLTTTLLALITLLMRSWVRFFMIRNAGWDDYMIFIAMIVSITMTGFIIPEVKHGAGRHIQYLTPAEIQEGLRLNFITQPICIWGPMFIKLSLGFFLLRIAATATWRRIIIGVMAFISIYTFIAFITIMVQCTDLRINWDRSVKATCWAPTTLKAMGYASAAQNLITDFIFSIVIPIPMLWSLQMNNRTKISLFCILGLGVFASSAAIVKLAYLPSYGQKGDWLWDSHNITIWIMLEINFGIIAANMTTFKPLFKHVIGSGYYSGTRSRTGGQYGNSTHQNHTGKHYSTLGSKGPTKSANSHTGEIGPNGEIMLTNIAGGKDLEAGASDADSKMSDESIRRLNRDIGGSGITKTTVVTTKVKYVDGLAPERQVEDRI